MVLDGKIKHLVLTAYELFAKICDKIKYLISKTVVVQIILIIILEGLELIHIVLCWFKKIWTFHVIVLIKPVVKNKNNYYCHIFLEKSF